ncbi:MAG: hypothetical protein LBP23_00470 [Treponema sp.]|jgi:hypothetical protein|nr:hypothetical protein [Treponema sp.]
MVKAYTSSRINDHTVSGARRVRVFISLIALALLFSCENMMVRELLRAPVTLESISVTSDVWAEGEAPYALSPTFEPGVTSYVVTVPYRANEVWFQGTPRLRASVRYAAADGSAELRPGVFAYTGIEDRVFIVTAWEEYMDDTSYEITVKRENPEDYLEDLRVWYETISRLVQSECRKGSFIGSGTEYEADIPAEGDRVVVLAQARKASTVEFRYGAEEAIPGPVDPSWRGERYIGGERYEQITIPFTMGQARLGQLSVTTTQPGRQASTYTVRLKRLQAQLRLAGASDDGYEGLVFTPLGGTAPGWTPGNDPLEALTPQAFDKLHLNYGGEVSTGTRGVKIEARLPPQGNPDGSHIRFTISPVADWKDGSGKKITENVYTTEEVDNKDPAKKTSGGSVEFVFGLPKYTILVEAVSGVQDILIDTPYTAVLTQEGRFTVGVPGDGDGKVRVYRTGDAGKAPVENEKPGTPLTAEVTPGLGYVINSLVLEQMGAVPADSAVHAVSPGGSWSYQSGSSGVSVPGGDPAGTAGNMTFIFSMPSRAIKLGATFKGIDPVAGVAYVSGDGWNSLGYGEDYSATVVNASGEEETVTRQAAASWGTASDDLQAVINNWDGSNFTEIWVHGTVTPKTNACINGYVITSSDPSDLAFVIPPGLKIYGGFEGKETGSKVSSGSDPRGENVNSRLTVLSGAQIQPNKSVINSCHVVIMADIPYTAPDSDPANTLLDGLTISGGIGADDPDTISVKTGYDIDRQSGAGIYLVNASPVLNNVRIENNRATSNTSGGGGGGIYNLANGNGKISSPRLIKTTIYNNSVTGNGGGGGMYNRAETAGSIASPVLDEVTIEMNQTSGRGGGLSVHAAEYNAAYKPHIKNNSRIIRNAAAYGGGVSISGCGAPEFTDVVIGDNNSGSSGGGVAAMDAATRPVFTNAVITGNTSSGGSGGGGVYNTSSYLVIRNAAISRNTASTGGGLRNIYNGGAILTNVLFDGNTVSTGSGGAICNAPESNDARNILVVTNGIIRNNKARYGGGIYSGYSFTGTADANLINYLVLTNVLITANEATGADGAGGGIRVTNSTPAGSAQPGKGVDIVMNNVTIAKNTAVSGSGVSIGEFNDSNKITVKANNSIIWGTPVPYDDTVTDDIIVNASADRLTLKNSLAWSKNAGNSLYTGGGGNKTASSFAAPGFTGSWGPFAGADNYAVVDGSGGGASAMLIDGGDDDLYPHAAADLLPAEVLTGLSPRLTDFGTLITNYVIIDRDAAAAESTDDEPPSGAGNPRFHVNAIDVGAYEN